MRHPIQEIKQLQELEQPILLSGDERFFIDKAIFYLKKRHKKNNTQIHSQVIENEACLKEIISESLMPSLFSDSKCYFLYFKQTPNVKVTKILTELLSLPSSDSSYIFICPKLSSKQLQAKWISQLESNGQHYIAYPLKPQQQVNWVRDRLKQLNIQTDNQTYQLISNHYQGNLDACFQAMEKISLIYESGYVSTEDIEKILHQESEYSIFECIDACILGDNPKFQTIIKTLKAQKAEPVILLWAFLKELRVLAKIKFSHNKGGSLHQLFKTYYIWQTKQAAYQNLLNTVSLEFLYHTLSKAKEVDATIKGLVPGDSWHNIEVLLSAVALRSERLYA